MGNKIHVSSDKYVKELLRRYQKKHWGIKKEALPLKVKERPEVDKTPFTEDRGRKTISAYNCSFAKG